ncbi:MAG: orotate phosphoribosyltransferase [Candidatus Poribacteria bacterium]|nr:orotate phosphoribosyltransferase [Candidatus Poribacteria bacterium]
MTKADLAKQIRAVSYLTGEFKLRSGNISNFYWDKYRFESNPKLLIAIAEEMVKLLPKDFDGLAGLELGGIPLATAISLKTGIPCYYVRKEAKTYGTSDLIEGGVKENSKLVVIEDVITTAGQVCTSIEQVRGEGHIVEHVVAVIDRQAGGEKKINALGCSFSSVYTLDELETKIASP